MEQEKSRTRLLQVASFVEPKLTAIKEVLASELLQATMNTEHLAQIQNIQAKIKSIQFTVES